MSTPTFPTLNKDLGRPLRGALFGGGLTKDGKQSFIGRHHREAAEFQDRAKIVAGAFSDDSPGWSAGMAEFYQIDPARAYSSASECLDSELRKPADQKIDFVDIATPNFAHFPVAKRAIEAGVNVICEKPITMTVEEAKELARLARERGVVFTEPHVYGFWPCSTLAHEIVTGGELGKVLAVRVEYIQGWLQKMLEAMGCAQAIWRTDPTQTGVGGATGDIGSHGFDLARRLARVKPLEMMAQLMTYVPNRKVDDYSVSIIRCEDNVLLTVIASQISVNRGNGIQIDVDCTEGSLTWKGETPNELKVRRSDKPEETYGDDPNAAWAARYPKFKAACNWPGGHPEGLDRAWQNLFGGAFDDMVERAMGRPFDGVNTFYPNAEDGVEVMKYIHGAVKSSKLNCAWVSLVG